MKKLKFMLAAMLVAVVSMLAVSCTNSDDSSSDKSDYTVVLSLQGGGLSDTERENFQNEHIIKLTGVSHLEASAEFQTNASEIETLVKRQYDGKIKEDLYVIITLQDKDGKYVNSKSFTVHKANTF